MESTIYGDHLPSLFDYVFTTLGLVVFDELGAGQLDFLWQISPWLNLLLLPVNQAGQPEHGEQRYSIKDGDMYCVFTVFWSVAVLHINNNKKGDLPFLKWQYYQVFVQPKQNKWEKTLTKGKKTQKNSLRRVQVTDDSCQRPNRSWRISKTNLSIVGHSAEELQLQVELTGHAVEEEPQAARQVLSRHKLKSLQKKNTLGDKMRHFVWV